MACVTEEDTVVEWLVVVDQCVSGMEKNKFNPLNSISTIRNIQSTLDSLCSKSHPVFTPLPTM